MFEHFVRTNKLSAESSAELRQRLTSNVPRTLEKTNLHSGRHSSVEPTRNSDLAQIHANNDQSILGNNSSITTNSSNPLIVIQGFANRNIAHCADLPGTTLASDMQRWHLEYIHYRDSLPYEEATHALRFIKKSASYGFHLMWCNPEVSTWNLKHWDRCIAYHSLAFIDIIIWVSV